MKNEVRVLIKPPGAPGSPLRTPSPTLAVLTNQRTTVRNQRRRQTNEMISACCCEHRAPDTAPGHEAREERGTVDHNLRAKVLQDLAAFPTMGNSDIATTSPEDASIIMIYPAFEDGHDG